MSLTAQTDAAKELVGTVARAFYDDPTICVVVFLLRCKFLRDGPGMGKPLLLSTKQVRKTLSFLKKEHMVNTERVEGIVMTESGGRIYRRKKHADFWYIDLSRATAAIRLRLHLVRQTLADDFTWFATSSNFICPGYQTRACNGHYTEEEVQNCALDEVTGRFLCQECYSAHQNNPNPPPKSSYTLTLIDNSQQVLDVETKLRRFRTQMAAKHDGARLLRKGIYGLLKEVQVETANQGGAPVTSNFPSENGASDNVAPSSGPAVLTPVWNDAAFSSEAHQESRGSLRCRTCTGQNVVLDIATPSAGTIACSRANRGLGCERLPASGREESATPPQPSTYQNDSGRPQLITERPPKMACRQTTPHFLKDNIGRNEEEEERRLQVDEGNVIDLTTRTRGLKTETLLSSEDLYSPWVVDEKREQLTAADRTQALYRKSIGGAGDLPHTELDAPPPGLGSSDERPHSYPQPSLFRSTSSSTSYGSVEWESGDDDLYCTRCFGMNPLFRSHANTPWLESS